MLAVGSVVSLVLATQGGMMLVPQLNECRSDAVQPIELEPGAWLTLGLPEAGLSERRSLIVISGEAVGRREVVRLPANSGLSAVRIPLDLPFGRYKVEHLSAEGSENDSRLRGQDCEIVLERRVQRNALAELVKASGSASRRMKLSVSTELCANRPIVLTMGNASKRTQYGLLIAVDDQDRTSLLWPIATADAQPIPKGQSIAGQADQQKVLYRGTGNRVSLVLLHADKPWRAGRTDELLNTVREMRSPRVVATSLDVALGACTPDGARSLDEGAK